MSRAIIIHRRDLGNVVYSSNPSYNPPNDNATIDDYGNTTSAISVPVRFPDTIRNGNGNVESSKFVWAGNTYTIENITIENLTAAFNLPNDITDSRLTQNPEYQRIEPHFSVNIEASTSSIFKSQSSIPSLTQRKLVIVIPVYKESDYRRLGDSLGSQPVQYIPPQNGNPQQFHNFSQFKDSEFYGFVSTQPTSTDQMIQIVPKKLCVISDSLATSALKQPWNHTCPSNSRELARTDVICRMKNTSEIAGYNQGNITYYTNTGTQETNYTENTRIIRLRSIPFREDPENPSNIPLQTEDGIPVQVEGEAPDGTTQKYRVVVDEPAPSLSLTSTGVIVYAIVVLSLGLFVIMNLDSTSRFQYFLMLSILVFACIITFPVIVYSDPSPIKVFSYVTIGLVLLACVLFIVLSFFPIVNEFLQMTSGITNIILLGFIAIFVFVSQYIFVFYRSNGDQEEQVRNRSIASVLSYVPKVFVLALMFFTNPLGNLLSFTSLLSGKHTAFDMKKGVEKVMNQKGKINFTDSDIANLVSSANTETIRGTRALITRVNDSIIRTYYAKTNDDDSINVVSSYGTLDEQGTFTPDPKSQTPAREYSIISADESGLFNPLTSNYKATFYVVVLLILGISLILAQPSPVKKGDGETLALEDLVVSISLSVIIFMVLLYIKSKQQIGWYVFIPFTIAIIVNIVSNVFIYFG